MASLPRYHKAIAVLLVAILSVASHFVPALDGVSPEAINAVSMGLALAAVYAVPNKIAGFNVDVIASSILDVSHGQDRRPSEDLVPVAMTPRVETYADDLRWSQSSGSVRPIGGGRGAPGSGGLK